MKGYMADYSRSIRAAQAETNGLMPMTRAIGAVSKLAKVSRTEAREALEEIGPSEWHHTSKKFNRTDFYDTAIAVRWITARAQVAMLPRGWEKDLDNRLEGDMRARNEAIDAYASAQNIDRDILVNEFYGDWS